MNDLRIDPGMVSDSVIIMSIKIENGVQEKSFSGQEIPGHFELINLVAQNPDNGNWLVLKPTNNDPQLFYKGNLSDDFTQLNESAYRYRILISLILFLVALLIIFSLGGRLYVWLRRINTYLHDINFKNFNTQGFYDFFLQHKTIILFAFLIAIFSFGYELFNFSLSIDDEAASLLKASEMKGALLTGRWGFYLLNIIVHPYSVMPYFTTALSIIFLALTAVFFVSQEKYSLPSALVFLVIFISSPVHSYYLAFNLSFYYVLGMLLVTISFLLLKKAIQEKTFSIKKFIIPVLLLALSISFYQAMLAFWTVYIAYLLFTSFMDDFTEKISPARIIISAAVVSILGFLLYSAGNYLFRHIFLEPGYSSNSEYLDAFSGWGTSTIISGFFDLLLTITGYLTALNTSEAWLGWAEKSALVVILYLLFHIMVFDNQRQGMLYKILSLLVLLISPFTLIFLTGAFMPVRTLMSLPLMIAMLWFFAYQRSGALMRRGMLFLVLIILINNTYINTRLFYSSATTWEADKTMAHSIAERIYRLNPKTENGVIRVAFIGDYEHPENHLFFRSNVFGSSFFHQDSGNTDRIFALLKTVGVQNFEKPERMDFAEYRNEIAKMPAWPFDGAIAEVDGIVVVKLSD